MAYYLSKSSQFIKTGSKLHMGILCAANWLLGYFLFQRLEEMQIIRYVEYVESRKLGDNK